MVSFVRVIARGTKMNKTSSAASLCISHGAFEFKFSFTPLLTRSLSHVLPSSARPAPVLLHFSWLSSQCQLPVWLASGLGWQTQRMLEVAWPCGLRFPCWTRPVPQAKGCSHDGTPRNHCSGAGGRSLRMFRSMITRAMVNTPQLP